MAGFDAHPLLLTDTVSVWDVVCQGTCKHKSAEECVAATHMVFPYRGVYVHHVGGAEAVAEANQVVFLNEDEPYRISHPVEGGDSSLSIGVSAATLLELAPTDYLHAQGRAAFNRTRLRIDGRAQVLTALLRHSLNSGVMEPLEAETLTLALVRRALGERTSHVAAGSVGRQKCQFASKRDPLFASNRDPLCGDGIGLIHVVHRRDPRATRSAPTSDVAARVGGSCAPTWISPGGGPGEGFVSCGF